MKPISLHPLSLLVGCALAGGVTLLLSAAQSPGSLQPIPTTAHRFIGEVPASWWVFLELRSDFGGQPITYTVPQGFSLVVTRATGASYVRADGQSVGVMLSAVDYNQPPGNVDTGGTRVPFVAGTLLDLGYPGPSQWTSYLWGYLEPIR